MNSTQLSFFQIYLLFSRCILFYFSSYNLITTYSILNLCSSSIIITIFIYNIIYTVTNQISYNTFTSITTDTQPNVNTSIYIIPEFHYFISNLLWSSSNLPINIGDLNYYFNYLISIKWRN